jgi:hypothetical protein
MNIGEFDQIKAAMKDLAEILASYKKDLEKLGFSPLEIVALLTSFQMTMLSGKRIT